MDANGENLKVLANLSDYDQFFTEGEIRESFKLIRRSLTAKIGGHNAQVAAFKTLLTDIYNNAFKDGFHKGFDKGLADGYADGLKASAEKEAASKRVKAESKSSSRKSKKDEAVEEIPSEFVELIPEIPVEGQDSNVAIIPEDDLTKIVDENPKNDNNL